MALKFGATLPSRRRGCSELESEGVANVRRRIGSDDFWGWQRRESANTLATLEAMFGKDEVIYVSLYPKMTILLDDGHMNELNPKPFRKPSDCMIGGTTNGPTIPASDISDTRPEEPLSILNLVRVR